MKTIEITLYKFKELSKEAQRDALTSNASINVLHDWWNCTYDDALTIGIDIQSFDTYKGEIETKLDKSLNECVDIVLSEHGESCATYRTAKYFREAWDKLVATHSDGVKTDRVEDGKEADFDEEADKLERLFKSSMSQHYLDMLRTEYNYLITDKAIQETLEVNEYDFTVKGEIYH